MARFSVGQIDEPPSAEGLHGEVAAMVHSARGPRLRWNVEMRRRPLTSCVPPWVLRTVPRARFSPHPCDSRWLRYCPMPVTLRECAREADVKRCSGCR